MADVPTNARKNFGDIAPHLADITDKVLFGDVWENPALSPRDRGVAGSLALLTRTLGIVSGASVLTALQARGAGDLAGLEGFLAGYRYAFVAAGGGLLVALMLSLAVPRAWSRRV